SADLQNRLIIETSTVAPSDIEWMASFLQPLGASLIDSAIVGGIQRLAAGNTTFLVGASSSDYERARPILELAAEEIFYLGDIGSRSEEHTSELQSRENLVCRLLLEKKKTT